MFGGIGLPEIIIVLVIVLVIFGPKKLPDIGKALGKSITEFKRATREPEEIVKEVKDTVNNGVKDVKDPADS